LDDQDTPLIRRLALTDARYAFASIVLNSDLRATGALSGMLQRSEACKILETLHSSLRILSVPDNISVKLARFGAIKMG